MSSDSTFSQINPIKIPSLSVANSAKKDILKVEIIDFVVKDLQKIPNYQSLKNDIEILLHICNIVENLISKNKGKIDKKQLVVDIFNQVFFLNETEKLALEKQIQFLFDNKLITKIKKTYALFNNIKKN